MPYNMRLSNFGGINLALTLDCGQAFRWELSSDGIWQGGSADRAAHIIGGKDELIFLNAEEEKDKGFWENYFDFNTDYAAALENFKNDDVLRGAIEKYGCIRILRQEPWETLCSFIISACNNIPRIKGIIYRLCSVFGEESDGFYSFPSPETIASLNENDLAPIRAGYRVKGILDAAKKFSSGELIIDELNRLPYEELKNKLTSIYGVGQKVADCTILFGFGRREVFPVDRHIKRITESLYPNGLPECVKGYEGLAQQYLFCAARNL